MWSRSTLAWSLLAAAVWASSIVLPHPVFPGELPAPEVDFAAAARLGAEEAQRVQATLTLPLSYETRAVGELVRRAGRAEYESDASQLARLRADLRVTAAKLQSDELQRLRALQTSLFISALGRQVAGQEPSPDLVELAGSFGRRSRAAAIGVVTSSERLELAAAYRLRWTDLVGLGMRAELQAPANDWRLVLRWRLRQAEPLPIPDRGRAELSALNEIANNDPHYPLSYAKGVAWLHAGAPQVALEALNGFLAANPSGPYTFRARNYAMYAAFEQRSDSNSSDFEQQ